MVSVSNAKKRQTGMLRVIQPPSVTHSEQQICLAPRGRRRTTRTGCNPFNRPKRLRRSTPLCLNRQTRYPRLARPMNRGRALSLRILRPHGFVNRQTRPIVVYR